MRTHDVDWDALRPVAQDKALDAKRLIADLESERVGWEPDDELKALMEREAREERRSDNHRAAAEKLWADPAHKRRASAIRGRAWLKGKYDHLVGVERNPELTARMLEMRARGHDNRAIAGHTGLTYGAVWARIGGQRKKPHRSTVTRKQVADLRAKGLSFARVAHILGCSERTARDRLP